MGGWVLFRCDTLAHARRVLCGAGAAAAPTTHVKHPFAMYLDPLVATTLVVAVIGAMPRRTRARRWRDRVRVRTGAGSRTAGACSCEWSWLALVLIASCAALAAGTYNPFIYFRF